MRTDVVVVGAGLGGLSVAIELRRRSGADLDVVVIDERPRDAGAGGSGLIVAGLGPDPAAIAAVSGDDAFLAVLRLSQIGVRRLAQWIDEYAIDCAFRPATTERILLGDDAVLRRSQALLARAGVSTQRTGSRLRVAGDHVVDPSALRRGLLRAAERLGVRVMDRTAMISVDALPDGVSVRTAAEPIDAALVVLAAGARMARFDDWLRAISLAARGHLARVAGVAVDPAGDPISLGPGFAVALPDVQGRLIVAEGCQPMNLGDPFDAQPEPRVIERLRAFAVEHLHLDRPVLESVVTAPFLYTCDGLPLVGPHPGRARTLLCTGFNGQDLALATIAAGIAVDWLLEGRSDEAGAASFSPRRML